MAKTKTKTHNGYASKHWIIITLLVLTTALMIATVTYAWFLNTLKIPGVQGTTGTFKYEFIGFDQNSNIAFSHGTETDSSLLNEQDFHVNSGALVFDGSQQQGEFYVLVHKLEGSVDLDVSVRFNAQLDKLTDFDTVETEEGEPIDISVDQPMSGTAVQYVGGFWYCVEQVTGNYESLEAAKNAFGSSATEADGDSYFPGIRKQVRQASLDTKDYTCIRVTFGRKGLYQDYENSSSASFNNKKITIYAELNVAQKGGLPDSGTNQAHSIKTEKELKDALLKALPGDELIIESDITLLGDLIINRPLKLTVASGSLTVQGDVRYTYMGERDFEIDLTGGPLIVQRMPSSDVAGDVGGNFLVELPKSSLTIYGRAAAEEPDLSVENKMVVYTNYIQNEEENDFTDPGVLGMYLSSVRVTDANGAPKRISMAYTTKLTVGQHSSVGTISIVTAFENISMQSIRVFILNHGTIEGIDLSSMVYINGYANPRIYVHNYGVINTLPNQSFNIHLPAWARPYILNGPEEIDKETSGNTLIIREDGSEMTVKTEGNDVNRYNNSDIYDWGRNVLIDKVTNDGSSIIIHYLDGKEAWGEQVSKETSIATLVDHYVNISDPDYRINPEHVTTLKIVCYAASEFALTEADYEFIRREMPNLESIDLSEAYSENYQLPNNAFNGLANLSTIKLSDKDTGWGSTLFTGTQVTTITLPLNLKFIAEDALQGIRVLYARNMANILIQGASGPSSLVKYLAQIGESTLIDDSLPKDSTPKIILIFGSETARETMIAAVEQAHNTYYGTSDGFRDKTNSIPNAKELAKISRIFVGNNAQFIGDYLITLNNLNNQCTIHAYLGDSFDAVKEAESLYQFNFKQFTVNGKEFYNVVNYDSFAFFNIKMENATSPFEFGKDLVSIGDAAFYNANLPENVSLGGCQTIGHAALANNTKLKNLAALELITAGYYSVGGVSIRFANTPKLTYVYGYTFDVPSTRLDIGLVQYATDAKAKATEYGALTKWVNGMTSCTVIVHTEHYDYMPTSLVKLGRQATYYACAPQAYADLLVQAGYCTSAISGFLSFGAFDASTIGTLTFHGENVTENIYHPGDYLYNLNTDGMSYKLIKCVLPHGTVIDGYQVDKNGNYVYANERGVMIIPSYTDSQGRTTTTALGVFSYHTINNVELLTFADSYRSISGQFCGGTSYSIKKYFIHIDLNNIETISGNAFQLLPSLVSVSGDKVKTIGASCFTGCTTLRTVAFPEATSVGATAFSGCTLLEVVSLPKATFGKNTSAFTGCTGLRTATIGPQYAASGIFAGCTKLETIYIDLSNLDPAKKTEYLYLQGAEGSSTNPNLKVISIGEELTWEKSANSPYWNNDSDPSNDVELTYSQTKIDASFDQIVFADWVIENKVAAVMRASSDAQTTDIPYTVATPTYMLSKDGNQLTIQMATGLNTITGESYTIPQALAPVKDESGKTPTITTMLGTTVDMFATTDTVEGAEMLITGIEKNVYANKIFVDNVIFPSNLRRIGTNAFAGCSLGAVNIQGSNRGLVIENHAFNGAIMSSLQIQNVVSIGDKAFYGVKNQDEYGASLALSYVNLGGSLESIGVSAFEGALISSISTAHDASTPMILTIGESAFKNVKNGTDSTVNVNFGGAAVKFGPYCFQNVKMDSIIAPYTMLVQSYAFDGSSVSNLVDFSVGTPAQMVEVHGYQVIETLAFKGTSSNRLQLGTVKLGANALVKGGYRSLSGVQPIKTWSDVEYTGAFTYCDIGSFQFNANAAIQPEAVSFTYCTFDEIHMGAITVFGTGVSGVGVINHQNDLDSPYRIVDKNNAGIDNTGISKFIFKECTDFGTVYLGNVTDLMFSHHNNSGKPTIALEQVENLTTLREYAINKLTLTNDVVFPEGLPISGSAFSNSVINGNLTFSKNSSFTSSSIVSSTVNGKLYFSEGTVVGGTEPLKDSQFYGDIYFEDGVTISANYTFERSQIYATVSLGALTFTSGTNGVNAMFGNGANVGGGNHTKGYVQHLVIRNTLTEIPTQLLAYAQFDVVELQNVTKLGTAAFAHSRIGTIIGMEHVTYFGDNAFGCTSPTGSYAANASSYHKTTVGSGMNLANAEHIGAKAFIGMDFGEGKDIILSKVTYIGQNAFQNSTIHGDLVFGTRIDTGNGNYVYQGAVSEVSAYGFAGSTILGTIHFVNVESIGEGAFKQASLAQPLTIGNVSIADSAFYGVVLSAVTFTGSPVLQANSFKDSIITTITFEKGGVIEAEAFASDAKGETGVYDTINLGEVAYIGGSYSTVEVEGEGEQITYTGAFRNATIGTINFEDSCVVTETYTQPIADRAFSGATIGYLNFSGTARALVSSEVIHSLENASNAGLRSPFYGAEITRLNLNNVIYVGRGYFANHTFKSVDTIQTDIDLRPWSLSNTTIKTGSLIFNGATLMYGYTTTGYLRVPSGNLEFNGGLDARGLYNQFDIGGDMIIDGFVRGSDTEVAFIAHDTNYRSYVAGDFVIKNTPSLNFRVAAYLKAGGLILQNVDALNKAYIFSNSEFQERVDISCVKTFGSGTGRSFSHVYFPKNTYLNLPNTTTIGNLVFDNCKNIVYVNAPVLSSIGENAFLNNTSLKSISMPALTKFVTNEKATVVRSSGFTFSGCTALESVVIGDKLTDWGYDPFKGCSSKLRVIIEVTDPSKFNTKSYLNLPTGATLAVPRDSLAAYQAYANENGKLWTNAEGAGGINVSQIVGIQYILSEERVLPDNSTVTIEYVAELLYGNKIEIMDISIMPDTAVVNGNFTFPSVLTAEDQTTNYTVVSIASRAMIRLPQVVTSITLPDSMEFVNFSGSDTPSVQQFVIAESNEVYKTVDGILYTKNGEMLVLYPNGMDASAFELPEGVTYIGAYAFAGNRVTSSLSLSGNLVISDGAFSDCEYLTNVSLTGNFIFIGRNTIAASNPGIGVTVTGSCLVLYDAELREKITP